MAKELSTNSRSGLTVRFLSKKLELPQEEIEYLIDLHHNVFFYDLTKVKLVAEGSGSVRRINEGLKNHGDVTALFNIVKAMSPHDFRLLEERLGIEQSGPKKAAAELLIENHLAQPDSVVDYVATHDFSPLAQELFDIAWQSKEGVMPVAKLRAAVDVSEYEAEEALSELFQGCALFEMFRFDDQDRLVRVAGLLAELRQWRESRSRGKSTKRKLKAYKGSVMGESTCGFDFSDKVCRLLAAIAAKPVRLRGDGELFREDRRRLSDIVAEEDDPSLVACLWVAQGVGWLARVDSELRAADLEPLINTDRVERHLILFEWLVAQGNEMGTKRLLTEMLDDIKPGAWYPVVAAIEFALSAHAKDEQPVLQAQGGHWAYVAANATGATHRNVARSLEETFYWLGLVDRASADGESLFRVSDLGVAYLSGRDPHAAAEALPNLTAEIVVQPNFDIVVPSQEVDPLLTVPLDQFAERQSTGTATVYRLSKESFTKAIQDGHDGEAFVDFLLSHNRNDALPKNVLQTLEDWRGSVKRVRIRTVHILEADDPLVIADLMHRRRFSKYFSEIDPKKNVAITKATKAQLTKELEKEGFVVN
jgi:hypothetical protein